MGLLAQGVSPMEGWVACGECGTRYDTATFGFCPRCGSVRRSGVLPAASSAPGARAPRASSPVHQRRLQAGGAILLLVGVIALALAAYSLGPGLADVEQGVGALLSSQPDNVPGGTLALQTLLDGQPVAANVTLIAGGMVVGHAGTDLTGWSNTSLGSHGAVHVTVRAANRTLERNVLVVDGTTVALRLDVATDPADDPAWHGLGSALQAGLGLLAALALLLAAGGLAALLRRLRWLALLGPVPSLALALLVATGGGSLGAWAIIGTLAAAFALVVVGRSAFR